jgi:hypothetical protein
MFLSSCRKLCNPLFRRPRRPAQSRQFRPRLEGLEGRTVLTAPFITSTGILMIPGSTLQETIKVEFDNGSNLAIAYDDRVVVTVDYVGSHDVYYFAKWKHVGGGWLGWEYNIDGIQYSGGEGYNLFGNYTDIPSTAYGGNDGNYFVGGSNHDIFYGGDGTDYLYGGGNIDMLYGGEGADYLWGEGGDDHLFGQGGIDYLRGGSGNDFLYGGIDGFADELWGGSGNDRFVGEYYTLMVSGGAILKNRDQPNDFSLGDLME